MNRDRYVLAGDIFQDPYLCCKECGLIVPDTESAPDPWDFVAAAEAHELKAHS
jgi:hypothetical protein